MAKQVSLKDIAERVGVSSATVSLVLNGKEKDGRVGEEVSKRIRRVAKDLNYKPNNLARGLRMGRSQAIGLIVADITNAFFANLAFHIQEYAEKLNYTIIITNTNESVEKMDRMIDILRSQQVDGYIIVPTEFGEASVQNLTANKTPLVLIDRYFPDIEVNYVSVNNYYASKKITQRLISSGCKSIVMVIYKNRLIHMQERKRGYIDALKEASLYDAGLVKYISYENLNEEMQIVMTELVSGKERVDGIFFATNSLSIAGIKQLLKLNIKVPDEIKVACFDKNESFDFFDAKIPHANQPVPEMGKRAVDLLIEQIEKGNNNKILAKVELFADVSDE